MGKILKPLATFGGLIAAPFTGGASLALTGLGLAGSALDKNKKKDRPEDRRPLLPAGSELAASPAKRALRRHERTSSILDAESDKLGG